MHCSWSEIVCIDGQCFVLLVNAVDEEIRAGWSTYSKISEPRCIGQTGNWMKRPDLISLWRRHVFSNVTPQSPQLGYFDPEKMCVVLYRLMIVKVLLAFGKLRSNKELYWRHEKTVLPHFLAVQDSSIGDIVSQWVSESVTHLLILAYTEQSRAEQSRAEQNKITTITTETETGI